MDAILHVLPPVATVFGTIVIAVLLRRLGFPATEHSPVLARLIVDIALPAVIFVNLARGAMSMDLLKLPLFVLVPELIVLGAAWLVGRALRLSGPAMGSFLIASTFGAGAVIGYTVVRQMYPNSAEAMLDATMFAELGVGVGVLTLGVVIASHFGEGGGGAKAAILGFLGSRIFLALAGGFAWHLLGLPTDPVPVWVLFDVLGLFGDALPLLAALVIGLMLKPVPLRAVLPIVAACIVLKLVAEPLLSALLSAPFGLTGMERDVMVVMTAMPAGTISAVYAARYGCDGALASALVVATTVASALTMTVALSVLG